MLEVSSADLKQCPFGNDCYVVFLTRITDNYSSVFFTPIPHPQGKLAPMRSFSRPKHANSAPPRNFPQPQHAPRFSFFLRNGEISWLTVQTSHLGPGQHHLWEGENYNFFLPGNSVVLPLNVTRVSFFPDCCLCTVTFVPPSFLRTQTRSLRFCLRDDPFCWRGCFLKSQSLILRYLGFFATHQFTKNEVTNNLLQENNAFLRFNVCWFLKIVQCFMNGKTHKVGFAFSLFKEFFSICHPSF